MKNKKKEGCDSCKYKENNDEGFCYMFKVQPFKGRTCGQYIMKKLNNKHL